MSSGGHGKWGSNTSKGHSGSSSSSRRSGGFGTAIGNESGEVEGMYMGEVHTEADEVVTIYATLFSEPVNVLLLHVGIHMR